MKKLLMMFVLAGCLVSVGGVKAQYLTGELLTSEGNFSGGSVTSTSVTLINSNVIDSTYFPSFGFGANSFYTLVPSNSLLFAYSTPISGLSATPTAVSINDFFVFSYPESGFGVSTSPADRFDFNLETIADSYVVNTNNTAIITGTGTIVDTTGAFQDTLGQFTITFEHPDQYEIILEAVPEPATISLATAGLLCAIAIRRRKA